MIDEPEGSSSRAVTNKVDMRSSHYGTQLVASAKSNTLP